jgi:hypothetical protein
MPYEVNMSYSEDEENKNALVKVYLCAKCGRKLNKMYSYLKKKRKRDKEKKILKKKKKDNNLSKDYLIIRLV